MKVSVNIVTRNRPILLIRAINSVLEQDFDDYEIVVVDNSGIDVVEEHINKLDNPKIRVVTYSTISRGLTQARNVGLIESKGEYIAVLDDDDIFIDSSKIRAQVEFLDRNSDYVLIGTDIKVASPNGVVLGIKTYPHNDNDIRQTLLVSNQFCHSAIMFRRKSAIDVCGYEKVEGLWNTNEYRLWLKLGMIGKMHNLDMLGSRYTYWSKSQSIKHRAKLYLHDFKMVVDFKKLYPNFSVAMSRYLIQYPLKYTFRIKWWERIDQS